MKIVKQIAKVGLGVALLLVVALVIMASVRTDLSEFDDSYASPATAPVTVRFFGTSSMMFSDGKTNIMIDGWFTRPDVSDGIFGKIEPDVATIDAGLKRLGNPEIAALIPVHSHYDHAMDVAEIAKKPGVALLGSQSTKNIALGACEDINDCDVGRRTTVMSDGDYRCFGNFKITLFETEHFENPSKLLKKLIKLNPEITAPLTPPAPVASYGTGLVYSVLIEHTEGTALVHASAGYKEGALAALDLDVDTVFLGIGGLASKNKQYQDDYWREVVTATKAEGVYPIHWDSLTDSALKATNRPFAPNLIANDIFNAKAKEGIKGSFAKARQDGLSIALLPMWDAVDAFLNNKPSQNKTRPECPLK